MTATLGIVVRARVAHDQREARRRCAIACLAGNCAADDFHRVDALRFVRVLSAAAAPAREQRKAPRRTQRATAPEASFPPSQRAPRYQCRLRPRYGGLHTRRVVVAFGLPIA